MRTFRILVADDHPIFRFGVSTLLASHEGWEVCGEAADGRDTVGKCAQLRPDLLILDICMPKLNGVDAARQILRNDPSQKILILTDVDSEQVVRGCLDAGVRGWVYKSDRAADLTTAVEALQGNKSVFPSRVSDLLMDSYRKQRGVGSFSAKLPHLSPREREVVQLLAESKTSKEVATILNISLKTVETHRSNILLKLNLHSVTELVLYAVRNEIVHVQLPSVRRLPRSGNGRKDLTVN